MSDAQPFRFVQIDFPGHLGLNEGRYLVREPSALKPGTDAGPADESTGQPSHVLVVTEFGAPRAPRGRLRRRPRPTPVEPDATVVEVPLTRLTVISADPIDSEAGSQWVSRLPGDEDAVEALLDEAILIINRALHAHRAAAHNPYIGDVAVIGALAARIGYGPGDQLADGRSEEALEIPISESRRKRRAEMLRPQEQVAAILGGRAAVDISDILVLRARADLDAGRTREAALQLRAGFEALLAELGSAASTARRASAGTQRDLAALEGSKEVVSAAVKEALGGELSPDRTEELVEVLAICERALRRRRVMAQ